MKRTTWTLKEKVTLEGSGLHTGKKVKVVLEPRKKEGLELQLGNENVILSPYLAKGNRCTTLTFADKKVWTVEHLLSALCGLGFLRCNIIFEGDEVPCFDSSSKKFVEEILSKGFSEPLEEKVLELKKPFYIKFDEFTEIVALPSAELKITYILDYEKGPRGEKTLKINVDIYREQICKAKTFILYEEIEEVRKKGLGQGGDINNVLVFKDGDWLNREIMTYPDEPVRHKILDLLGDLYLIGKPFVFHIIARRTGHRHNITFVQKITRHLVTGETIDIQEILKLLPHRYPFLLVDRIISIEDKKVIGMKNVTINEPFYEGHFPERPIMPGVLILEAMAQVGGVLIAKKIGATTNKIFYFAGIDKVKFRKPVIPGDTIHFVLELLRFGGKICRMRGTAYVDDDIVAEAELTATVMDK